MALITCACSSVGPGAVMRDRVDYAGAMSDSWKDQLLLNIVRIRYADPPTFMDVSSVVGGYTLDREFSLGAESNFGAVNPTTGSFGIGGSYGDHPTISYTPLSGQKFSKSLLEPIKPSSIFSLITAGYPADVTLLLTVNALNGVYNRTVQGGRQPADPDFYPLVRALRRLQLSRSFSTRIENREGDDAAMISFTRQPTPETQQDIELIKRTLNLNSADGEIILTSGVQQQKSNELAMSSRSMLQILIQLSSEIEVPAESVAEGRTYPNAESILNPDPFDLPLVSIHSAPTAPSDAYAAVQTRGSWYWIDDGDFASKRVVTFLLLFFSLAETGVVPVAPTLTIPVQ